MRFRLALAAATALSVPLIISHAAKAQPVTGLYSSVKIGLDYEAPVTLKSAYGGNGTIGQTASEIGGGGIIGIGYGFGNGFRVEIGPNIFYNPYKRFSLTSFPYQGGNLNTGHGAQFKYGPMVSGFYDFDVGLPIIPYVGVGVGYERNNLSPAVTGRVGGYYTKLGGSEGSFSYMGAVGFTLPIPSIPGLGATLEYRFMGLTGNQNYNFTVIGHGVSVQGKIKMGGEYDNIVTAGLRYQWNNPQPAPPAPAPAPMATPAPAPAKTYLVFFDWDKATLTPRATDIIAQAASDSKTQQTTTIAVNGYTDTSGTPTYNQGLSVRRANAVAAQLVADGVPSSEITAQGFGENDLLVQTGPGVREPQNRRVQIVLQ